MDIAYSNDAVFMERYLRQYFLEHGMVQSEKALDIAIPMHKMQKRAEGLPYIVHPMAIAMHAIASGHSEDDLIAIMLLHDVCEDCGVTPEELDVNDAVREGVRCMTNLRRKEESKADSMGRYMEQIRQSREACLAKIFDRCHNVSTMAEAFSDQKMTDYIIETKEHIYPLIDYVKQMYPEYAETVFLLEYQMKSVILALERNGFVRNLPGSK